MARTFLNGRAKHRHLNRFLQLAETRTIALDLDLVPKPAFQRRSPPQQPPTTAPQKNDPAPVVNLDDTKQLFRSLTTPQLLKSYAMLRAVSMDFMVGLGGFVMERFIERENMLKAVAVKAVEHSVYSHFCAGTDLEKAAETVERLSRSGLRSMLDYGIERTDDGEACDQNMNEFIRTIRFTSSFLGSKVSLVAVKMTAIVPQTLLRRLSDLLRWAHKEKSFDLPWKLETLPIFSDSSPFYHTKERPSPLSLEEERELELGLNRFSSIIEESLTSNVTLVIDAEETWIQPAVDYLVYSSLVKYKRKGEKEPLIYNTIQTYLKDAKERLVNTKRAADEMGLRIGFKLVRGAYMAHEEKMARELGAESPIHDGIDKTHACFDGCADFLLAEVAKGRGFVVLATHNVRSGKIAAKRAIDLGIMKDNTNIQFAQLYGMAEALSRGLKNEGFIVSKYLPFGPVENIMPYLIRRAEENKGLLANSSLDRQLMSKELLRRLSPC